MKFENSNIRDDIKKVIINELGFDTQTLIQEKSIPHILEGKDVLGESATGSGKTLAFAVGVVDKVEPGKGTQALILAPTRELAEQVNMDISKVSSLKTLSVYGGVSINPQIDKLRKAEIVIATPGRLMDHMQRKTIDLSKIKVLVLDEADRMLDMGFIEDIEHIIKACPKNRQNLFFSATLPPTILKLANKHMKNPVSVSAVKMVDPSKLEQVYYDVERNMKLSLLVHLINQEQSELIMVFCNTRKATDMVVKTLKENGVKAIALHGGFTQNKRDQSIESFKKGKKHVLVCTDVAARGIHIEGISHIYNYDIPKDSNDYVHRIGRTARAGEAGKVINLLAGQDHDNFSRILHDHTFKIKKIKKPYVEKVTVKTEKPKKRRFRRR